MRTKILTATEKYTHKHRQMKKNIMFSGRRKQYHKDAYFPKLIYTFNLTLIFLNAKVKFWTRQPDSKIHVKKKQGKQESSRKEK